jgi:DNA-binding transcriptional MerR regulator
VRPARAATSCGSAAASPAASSSASTAGSIGSISDELNNLGDYNEVGSPLILAAGVHTIAVTYPQAEPWSRQCDDDSENYTALSAIALAPLVASHMLVGPSRRRRRELCRPLTGLDRGRGAGNLASAEALRPNLDNSLVRSCRRWTALTIQEAAETTGWSPRMLRYIERAGLLELGRSPSGYRLYGPEQLQRLRTLRELLARMNFGLAELGFALRLRREPELRAPSTPGSTPSRSARRTSPPMTGCAGNRRSIRR